MQNNSDNNMQDKKLAGLLSSLKEDVSFPDNFESNFLQEMHRRREQNISEPAKSTLGSFISGLFSFKVIYGTATAAVAALVIGIVLTDQQPGSSPHSGGNETGAILTPVSAKIDHDGQSQQKCDSESKKDADENK